MKTLRNKTTTKQKKILSCSSRNYIVMFLFPATATTTTKDRDFDASKEWWNQKTAMTFSAKCLTQWQNNGFRVCVGFFRWTERQITQAALLKKMQTIFKWANIESVLLETFMTAKNRTKTPPAILYIRAQLHNNRTVRKHNYAGGQTSMVLRNIKCFHLCQRICNFVLVICANRCFVV